MLCHLGVADRKSEELNAVNNNSLHLYSYLKIFLNFLQLSFLLKDVEINWSHEIQNYLQLHFSISNFSEFFLIGECLIKGNKNVDSIPNIYLNAILIAIFPFTFLFGLIGVGFLMCFIRRNVIVVLKKVVIISFYVFYMTVIYFMLRIVNCVEFEQDYFMKFYLVYKCYDDDYNTYVYFFFFNVNFIDFREQVRSTVVPTVIFWFGFYQFFILTIPLLACKQKLSDFKVKSNFGYLYNGYSFEYFYWYAIS